MSELEIIEIEAYILTLRGQRVLLDRDLARLYGVTTKSLNQAIRRNPDRFPEGFMFRLTASEQKRLVQHESRLAAMKHAGSPPLAFCDYGVAMLSSVLRSPRASQVNVRIIQTFVRMRRLSALDGDVRAAVTALQAKVGEHDGAIRQIMDALGLLGRVESELRSALGLREDEKI